MATEKIPGLAYAILTGQEIAHALGLGVASVESGGPPVTPETVFRIGSVTKVLTGASILRLVDAGRLDLDAPLTDYVPWPELNEPGACQHITPRMLLTHTSGLPTDLNDHGVRDPRGLADFLRAELPKYPLVAQPGIAFSYSNLGFALLGHIAEVVTGQTYSDLMRDLVFLPLEMGRTTLDPTLTMRYPLSQSHRLMSDGSLSVVRAFADNAAYAPAGFAFSTVLDLANFARMLLARGRFGSEQFLSTESTLGMSTAQVPTYSPGAGGWGLAMFVDPHPRSGMPRVGHMGGITGYRALFEVYPTLNAAVVVLMNQAGDLGAIRDVLLEECLGVETAGWSPAVTAPHRAAWRDYVGTYLSDTAGLAEIMVDGDQLLLDRDGDRFTLDSLGSDHYVSTATQGVHIGVGFIRGDDGRVEHLMLSETLFRRVQPVSADLHPETWKHYEGSYALRQPPMSVRADNDSLFLHSAFYGKEVRCVPLSDVDFACQWGHLSFRIGHGGRTEGIVWAGTRFIPRLNRKP